MTSTNCTSAHVKEIFQALLTNTLTTPQPNPPAPRSPRLTSPPPKNSIRLIEHDVHNRREKYDGRRWRLVCVWDGQCPNIAVSSKLCVKHNAIRRNKEPPSRKKKSSHARSSLPISKMFLL